MSRCVTCRKMRANAPNPLMSDLPLGRLAYGQFPFCHCGIDYFGPMLVKVGRRREKRWGVIFTCLTTKAIHLEIAHLLNADSAIMAIQRMSARRRTPFFMYSDQAKNLKGANDELRKAICELDKNKLVEFGIKNRMRWIFNPAGSPHMGGVWESLVKSVKIILQAILKEEVPRDEVLATVFAEAEHSVNSRPLTDISVDPQELEALTPNIF